MYQEPPDLDFKCLQNVKSKATEILSLQRTATTPETEFQNFELAAVTPAPTPKRPNRKACEFCKKKKIKCDVNYVPTEKCTRSSCQCSFHINDDTAASKKKADMLPIPFTNAIRDPGLTLSGHYAGETAFCTTHLASFVITEEDNLPTVSRIPAAKPTLTMEQKRRFIHLYYDNMNPFSPLMSKHILLKELDNVFLHRQKSYLSPLFFYALFARAAQIGKHDNVSTDCFRYAADLINEYRDKPRVSTILALVLLTHHLEPQKKHTGLTRSWLWAGEAFRMALDLGIHRASILDEDTYDGQLCIRTFWIAYITDSVISMQYGRPSSIEDKVIDTQQPKRIPDDDPVVSQWVSELRIIAEFSKVTSRIIKFNYSPPPKYIVCGPAKRGNAFLVTVEDWLYDTYQKKEAESPISHQPNQFMKEDVYSKRLDFQKTLFLYVNLILLHCPHVDDFVMINKAKKMPSYSVCAYTAVLITDIANKLDLEDLHYHAKYPILAYALILAIRMHIINATRPNPEKFNASTNYHLCLAILRRLPQSKDKSTMLFDAIEDIQRQASDNFLLARQREEQIRTKQRLEQQQRLNHPILTTSDIIFSSTGTATEARKTKTDDKVINLEIPCVGPTKTKTSLRFKINGVDHPYTGKRKDKTPPSDAPEKKRRQPKEVEKQHVPQPQPFHFVEQQSHNQSQLLQERLMQNHQQTFQEIPPFDHNHYQAQMPFFEDISHLNSYSTDYTFLGLPFTFFNQTNHIDFYRVAPQENANGISITRATEDDYPPPE